MAGRRHGQIIRKGERKWLVRWSDGTDESGERLIRSRLVEGSKLDAETYLAEVLDRKRNAAYVAPSDVSLAEYFDSWLHYREHVDDDVCERTVIDNRRAFDRYVRKALGSKRLSDLQPTDLEALYADVRKAGVGPRTVSYVHGILRTALRAAVRRNAVASAVTDRVQLPKQKRRDVRVLQPEEIARFRAAAASSGHAALFDFLLGTGARPGEALALRWSDVDLDARVARIERALSRPGGRYVFQEPKTEKSRRAVLLDPEVVASLREHRSRQAEQRLGLGSAWNDLGLVFPGPLGGPADELAINRRAFKTALRRAGLPSDATLYSLRHTFATLALKSGSTIHEVASAMGHTSPALVLSTYGHSTEVGRSETFAKVGSLAFRQPTEVHRISHTTRTPKRPVRGGAEA